MKVKTGSRSASAPQSPRRLGLKAVAGSLLLGGSALPVAAMALTGPYVGLEAGPNWSETENMDQNGFIIGDLRSKLGYSFGANYGFAFPFGLRPEFELNYRRNQYGGSRFGGATVGVGGYNSALTGMGNLWYDFKLPEGFFSRVHPYLGGGVGVVRFGVNHVSIAGVGLQSDHNYALGYQGGAGVAYDLAPNLTLSTDWRFLETNREDYKLGIAGGDTRMRYRAQTMMVGLKLGFGGPPAPPPPPPAPVAVVAPPPPPPPPAPVCKAPPGFQVDANCNIIEQTLVVHQVDFEFNSDRLTAPAQATLDPIGAALAQQPNLTVSVNGYTDNIGSAAYNRKLSERRAAAVRSYLISKGVNPASLNAEGYGKDNPIASNDNAEGRAENRRVEFVIRNAPAHLKVEVQGATAETTQAAEQGGEAQPAANRHHRRHHHTKPAAQPQQ